MTNDASSALCPPDGMFLGVAIPGEALKWPFPVDGFRTQDIIDAASAAAGDQLLDDFVWGLSGCSEVVRGRPARTPRFTATISSARQTLRGWLPGDVQAAQCQDVVEGRDGAPGCNAAMTFTLWNAGNHGQLIYNEAPATLPSLRLGSIFWATVHPYIKLDAHKQAHAQWLARAALVPH